MTNPQHPAQPLESVFGVSRIKAGPGGGAVRLAVLVRDLMQRHQMARAGAVLALLLPPLEVPNPPALYRLQPGGDALPLEDMEWFATGDGRPGLLPGSGRRIYSRGIGQPPPAPAPNAHSLGRGLVGAVAWLRNVWGSASNTDAMCFDRLECVAVRLAVSEQDAVVVWGWGADAGLSVDAAAAPLSLADFDALVVYRKGQKAANVAAGKPKKNIPWADGNQLDVLHAEYERLGKNTSATESMAKALDITRQAVETALNKEWKRAPAASWVAPLVSCAS